MTPMHARAQSLKLMEDGELCVRMHMGLRRRGRGRQAMVGRVAETSGRRFDQYGELHMVRVRSRFACCLARPPSDSPATPPAHPHNKQTLVHFVIGLVWYFAVENFTIMNTDDLAKLCARLYPDVR